MKMGDRISISFRNKEEQSVALFSHWDGLDFIDKAETYVKELYFEHTKSERGDCFPLDRFDPDTLMVDFIRYLTSEINVVDRNFSNYYLGKDEYVGDNSDNGHFEIDINMVLKDLREDYEKSNL